MPAYYHNASPPRSSYTHVCRYSDVFIFIAVHRNALDVLSNYLATPPTGTAEFDMPRAADNARCRNPGSQKWQPPLHDWWVSRG
jgi:hypothetical protein